MTSPLSDTTSLPLPKAGIFRQYDIRGLVGDDLTEAVAWQVGRAFGSVLREGGTETCVLSRDNRESSEVLGAAMIQGLNEAGITVLDNGLSCTPAHYFAVNHLKAGGGIMITGSHNPKAFNGFKINLGPASIYGEAITALYDRIKAKNYSSGTGRVEKVDIREAWLNKLLSGPKLKKKWKVVADSGNGTAGIFLEEIFQRAGAEVEGLFLEPDADYPNHHPDPTVEKNMEDLIRRVRESEADIGFAFDGDSDRLGIVDEKGTIIWGDEILVLLSRDLLSRHPGATIIYEVKCSKRLGDDIQKHGGIPVMWKAGHSLIKAKMRETGALLAGEMSGHLFFSEDYYGFDDPFFAALKILHMMDRTGKKPSELLADLPTSFSTPELRVEVTDETKFDIVAKLTERMGQHPGATMITLDGLRVEFEDGWGLVRASNTQPVLVTRFEALSQDRLDEIRKLVEDNLKAVMGVDELILGGH